MAMFKTRLGLLTASLGMAIGTGNIWRFPRKVAQYGGSAYIMVWLLGLLIWSIPLLMVEAGIGRASRRGVPFAFADAGGRHLMGPGVFVAMITTLIMFYYTVVTGWCAGYFVTTLIHGVPVHPAAYWKGFEGSFSALAWSLVIALVAGFVVLRGVEAGIERLSLILMPILFLLLIGLAVYAAFIPGSGAGFEQVFAMRPSAFADPSLWIDGISQSAWSTGAGWGLYMTYSSYAGKKQGMEATTYATGFGNNLASLLAASAIIPLVFAVLSGAGAKEFMGAGNTGLAFIAVPLAFVRIGGLAGRITGIAFFTGLLFAALSSLIAMFEMVVLILGSAGMKRGRATVLITLTTMLFAVPSAISPWFFNNQDWVWGVGLLISGMCMSVLVIHVGPSRFVSKFLPDISPVTRVLVRVAVPVLVPAIFLTLTAWYLVTTAMDVKSGPWSLKNPYSVTLTLAEWFAAGLLSWVIARFLSKHAKEDTES